MRRGYVLIILFSLLIAVLQSLKYRLFTRRDSGGEILDNLIIQTVILFLLLTGAGVLAVRWYYKLKDK